MTKRHQNLVGELDKQAVITLQEMAVFNSLHGS